MKRVILLLVVALSVATASAQIKLGVSPGIQLQTEAGDDGLVGFGGAISGEYLINPNIGLGVNLGYYIMDREKVGGYSATVYLMPATLTGKYYFLTEDVRPYGGVDVGLFTAGARTKVERISKSYSETKFGLAPVVGCQFGLGNNLALDVNVKYSHVFVDGGSDGFVGINVGVVYSFGR